MIYKPEKGNANAINRFIFNVPCIFFIISLYKDYKVHYKAVNM